jgi:site-specific DNA-methyltransferase (cytosine-N4-specific)
VKPYYADESVTLYHGDALTVLTSLPDASVNCCVTSPPYFGLRDYGVDGQLGLEASPAEYVENLRARFAQVRRVLADDGTLWLNLGDSYVSSNGHTDPNVTSTLQGRRQAGMTPGIVGRRANLPPKSLLGMPWRTVFALQDDGWTLRNDIIWAKPNAMPESVTDRLSTKHEHLFLFAKSPRYWFDLDPIRATLIRPEALTEGLVFGGKSPDVGRRRGATYGKASSANLSPTGTRHDDIYDAKGRNPGDVWSIPTQPFPDAHFAVMPRTLAERAIQAGCKPGGTVLDPFSGSGTTGLAAARHGRKYVGIDLNAEYLDLSLRTRLAQPGLDLGDAS